ncbi:MAG: hypothetical protein SF066_15780 [Thermoanaerobaculia bacterium]|nr:hypothetical protein [Thermoanaerobaculia bacterium]
MPEAGFRRNSGAAPEKTDRRSHQLAPDSPTERPRRGVHRSVVGASESAERERSPPLPAQLFLRAPRAVPKSIPFLGWQAANGGKVGRRPTQLVFGWVVDVTPPELHRKPASGILFLRRALPTPGIR